METPGHREAWLEDLLQQVKDLRAENKKIMEELLAERKSRNEERLEERLEVERLRQAARHAEELAEARMEAATAAWRNGSWWDNAWRGGP